MEQVRAICRACGAIEIRLARDRGRADAGLEGPQGRLRGDGPHLAQLHRAGRRHPAHGAAARCCARSRRSSAAAGLRVANVFHAGDGNLHPLVLYDRRVDGQEPRRGTGRRHPRRLRRGGGSITGEHGVGAEKKKLHAAACSPSPTWTTMQRCAAPSTRNGLANPGKVMPPPRLCGEVPGPYRRHPLEEAGLAERF